MPAFVGRGRRAKSFKLSKPLAAVTGFSLSNFYQTAVAGAEVGTANGFGFIVLCRIQAAPSASYRAIYENYGTGPVAGFTVGTQGANGNIIAGFTNGSGVVVNPPIATLYPSDYNKIIALVGTFTNVGTCTLNVYRDFNWSAAIVGCTLSTYRTYLGKRGTTNTYPADGIEVISVLTFRGNPSTYQISSLLADIRTDGDLPTKLTLATPNDAAITALAPRHWYLAENNTLSGPNLATLPNLGSAGGSLSVTAGTVLAPTADATLGGMQSFALTGTQYLDSSHPASEFRYFHDGTGCDVFVLAVPVAISCNWLATLDAVSGSDLGFSMQYGASGNIRTYAGNGTQNLFDQTSAANSTPLNAPLLWEYTYGSNIGGTITPMHQGAGNVLTNLAIPTNAPAAGDPEGTLRVGASTAATNKSQVRIASILIFNRKLTEEERNTVRNWARTRASIASMATTINHRWSARTALLQTKPTDGQTAPTLPDTVTESANDKLDIQGTPTVKLLDQNIDGRKTYGICGFGSQPHYYLRSANGAGIRGNVAGFTVRCVVTFYSIGTGLDYFAVASDTNVTAGWGFARNGATLSASVGNGVSENRPSTRTLTATDVGVPHLLHLVMAADGVVTLYFDGVACTPSAAGVWKDVANPMYIGVRGDGAQPAYQETVYILAGSHTVATAAEVLADFEAWKPTGKLQSIPGKPDLHRYDIHQDIVENGGPANGIPLKIKDRVGTDHIDRIGGIRVQNGGLTNFVGQLLHTLPPNHVAGVATGFWVEVLIDFVFASGTYTAFSTYYSGNAGWTINLDSRIYVNLYSSTGAVSVVKSGIANGLRHAAFVYDGSIFRLYVDGVEQAQSTSFVYVPASASAYTCFGTFSTTGAYAVTSHDIRGGSVGYSIPTAEEIATAAASALATGKVVGVPGKTDRLWSIVDDVIEANGNVPIIYKDRVGGKDIVLGGGVSQVAQRVERLWGYEKLPILYGASGFTLNHYYEATTGISGHPSGFWVATLFRIDTQAVASKARIIVAKRADTDGWQIYTNATNSTLYGCVQTTSNYYLTPAVTLAAGDVGKLLLAVMVYDVGTQKIRMYYKRVEQGTGTTTAGTYTVPTAIPMRVGRSNSTGDASANGLTVFGVAGGDGGQIALGRIQAYHDAAMALEDLPPTMGIPGFGGSRYSFSEATRAAGGTIPASVTDSSGKSDSLVKVGSPTLVPHYTRSWIW